MKVLSWHEKMITFIIVGESDGSSVFVHGHIGLLLSSGVITDRGKVRTVPTAQTVMLTTNVVSTSNAGRRVAEPEQEDPDLAKIISIYRGGHARIAGFENGGQVSHNTQMSRR